MYIEDGHGNTTNRTRRHDTPVSAHRDLLTVIQGERNTKATDLAKRALQTPSSHKFFTGAPAPLADSHGSLYIRAHFHGSYSNQGLGGAGIVVSPVSSYFCSFEVLCLSVFPGAACSKLSGTASCERPSHFLCRLVCLLDADADLPPGWGTNSIFQICSPPVENTVLCLTGFTARTLFACFLRGAFSGETGLNHGSFPQRSLGVLTGVPQEINTSRAPSGCRTLDRWMSETCKNLDKSGATDARSSTAPGSAASSASPRSWARARAARP